MKIGEYCVQQFAPAVGRYDRAEVENEARRGSRPPQRRRSSPCPPTITTTSEFSSHCPSWPDAMFDCEAQTTAPTAASAEPTTNAMREGPLDVDPERRGHLLVVDAGADHHPGLGPVEPEPEPDARPRRRSRASRGARASTATPARVQVDEPVGPARPGQVDGVAAELLRPGRDVAREMGDDLVGDDHRDRDRDQRLAQLLTLVPAQERLLRDEADERRCKAQRRASGTSHSQVLTSVLAIEKPWPVIVCWTSYAM